MTLLELAGLRVDVPATHLAALGVVRVLHAQLPPARLGWRGGAAVLESDLGDMDAMARWLAEGYAPTPMVAPWQKGGFFSDSVKTPRSEQETFELAALAAPPGHRLAAWGATFRAVDRDVLPRFGTRIGGTTPDDKRKGEVIAACRAWLPDAALDFVDLAAVLDEERGDPVYGPVLGGTGGADGNKAIDTRVMVALTVLGLHRAGVDEGAVPLARALLRGTADADLPALDDGLLNASSSKELDGVSGDVGSAHNPWLTVLALEGMLLLAGSVHTREERAAAAFPWTIRASSRQLDADSVRDVFLPEWEGLLDATELARLYARGLLWAGHRPASDIAEITELLADAGPKLGVRRFHEVRATKRRGGNPNLVQLGTLQVPRVRRDGPPVGDLAPVTAWIRPGRGDHRYFAHLAGRLEALLRDRATEAASLLATAGEILRAAERAGADEVALLPLRPRWGAFLADDHVASLAAAAVHAVRCRLAQLHEAPGLARIDDGRAVTVLSGGGDLVSRLLEAVRTPVGAYDPTLGTTLAAAVAWALDPTLDDRIDALLAVLRRGRDDLRVRPPTQRGTPVPTGAVGPVVLAAQPLASWEQRPAAQPLVGLRRLGFAAAYEEAVRVLHRWGLPAVRTDVRLASTPDPRLAAALALPILETDRRRLAVRLGLVPDRSEQEATAP